MQRATEGDSFRVAMRLLAGAPTDDEGTDAASAGERPGWSEVVAGKCLASRLEGIQRGAALALLPRARSVL